MTTETLDFSKICRVCCLNGTLLSLFKVHLNRKLMACTNVAIWKDDGLPASICSKCISKLHIAFQFKKTCEKSDVKLRHILENVSKRKICQEVCKCHLTYSVKLTKIKNSINCQNAATLAPPSITQQQQSISVQNYEYISNVSSMQEVNKPTGNEITTLVTTQPVQTYSLNLMGMLDGLTNNGYAMQHLNVPVQYQTFSVSIDHTTNDGIIRPNTTLSTVSPQPIVSASASHNSLIVTNESMIRNDDKHFNDSPQSQTNDKTENKTCSTCGKCFTTLAKLSRHMKTHSREFTHRCMICHKGFTHGGNFKVHMRMHDNERPFSCTVCDHRSRQLQDLEKHKRKHNGERPYICQYCSKAFSTSSNLISHERIHRKEKPYVCSICHKAFCQSNELTKHFRTHTQEKSHTCKVCRKGFNGSSTLTVHMRTHNNERPHICHFCHKGFTQSNCLKVHLKRHGGDSNNLLCTQSPRNCVDETTLLGSLIGC